MRLRQFTPRQPIPDIPITPREWQPDPEIVIKPDDFHARAWECEYDEPIFHSDYNIMATPSSAGITIRSKQVADEVRSIPGTIPRISAEIIPQPDRSYDGMDMDYDIQPDGDASVEQLDRTLTNPAAQNTTYVKTRSQFVMTTTDINSFPQPSTERIRSLSGNPRNVLRN